MVVCLWLTTSQCTRSFVSFYYLVILYFIVCILYHWIVAVGCNYMDECMILIVILHAACVCL